MSAQLRGDYAKAGTDYRVEQDWPAYSAQEHALYRRLFERQAKLAPHYACPEWSTAIAELDSAREIPRFDEISRKLRRATGWEIVPVPGLIPDEAFFGHLASRRFPVTVWLRRPEEFDYIAEPDVFHDFFGHVPLLFDRTYADHLHEYGKGGLKAMRLDAVKLLARLYWYTIEFGLLRQKGGVRAYGAGILSSPGELQYAVESAQPQRVALDIERVMRTRYKIDSYQQTYFVIESFRELFDKTAPDFTPIYERIRGLTEFDAGGPAPG